MPSMMPEGTAVRKAIQWISHSRQENPLAPLPTLIEQACVKFNLPPKDCEFLTRFFAETPPEKGKKD